MIEANTWAASVLANLAMAAGAAAQASIGLGLNLFTVPILALIDPVFVPGPVLLHSFLVAIVGSCRLRRDINGRELTLATAGLLAGTGLAALLLAQVDPARLPRLFGILVLAAVLVTAVGYRIAVTRCSLVAASATAGVMGTIAGVHAPPVALLYQHESPQRVRSALLPFLAAANFISLLALAAIGMFGRQEIEASIMLLPGLVGGFLAAPWLIKMMSARAIRASILAISAVGGLALVLK